MLDISASQIISLPVGLSSGFMYIFCEIVPILIMLYCIILSAFTQSDCLNAFTFVISVLVVVTHLVCGIVVKI